ncbi:MAG: sugar transferase [Bacteroidales bacterium]|nr:sugar transferase [Bacteroidales bacterium]
MNNKIHTLKYLIFDILSASFAWILFNIFRKIFIETTVFGYKIPFIINHYFIISLFVIIIFWLSIYLFSGYYYNIYRKSRLQELSQTFFSILFGVLLLFFIFILDDFVGSYKDYYLSIAALFTLNFVLTYIPRVIITSKTINKLRLGKIGYNTLIIGSNGKAQKLLNEFTSMKLSSGYKFVGFVNVYENINPELEKKINYLGEFKNIYQIIKANKIEEIIIAVERNEHKEVEKIISELIFTDASIKIIPDLLEILIGKIEMSLIEGTPLLKVSSELMSVSDTTIKRILDYSISVIFIVLMLPLYIFAASAVKLSSPGPIIYKQKRVGKKGKHFTIYKFRSMYSNAENGTPELSSKYDQRITKFGKFLRKTRLDEIPQFFNVLKGDMSIVGPRPERQFFIDKIVKIAPEYMLLLKIKPGITSLGQVKYGYAENVEQMLERLKLDVIYIKNMSLYFDFKIMINTILVVFKRDGI